LVKRDFPACRNFSYLNKLHRHADNLACDNRNMQRELVLDLGSEILGLRKAIKESPFNLAKFRTQKQAVIVLGADDQADARLNGLLHFGKLHDLTMPVPRQRLH
jgi:hypothetical protein